MPLSVSGLLFLAYCCSKLCVAHHNDDICGNSNGRRLYLDLGERGVLTAVNITATFGSQLQHATFTGNLSSHKQCSLELVTCPACIISIMFHHLDVPHHCSGDNLVMESPCHCDYVWLSEPPYEDFSGIPFCGMLTSTGNTPLGYRSQTRSLAITLFYSERHRHAFTLEYTSERNIHFIKGSPGSGLVISPSHSGVLTSPFFPVQYPRDLGVEYIVTCQAESANNGTCRVRIVFRDFQLASASIMEFYDWNGNRLDVSSGASFRPPVILTTGPSALVRFYANGGTGLGFKAIYSFVNENYQESSVSPMTDCGGYVENFGGAITMMNMVKHGVKAYDCIWLIRPPNNYFHLRTHLYLKVATFKDMAGSTELQILQGLTSEQPVLETLRQPAAHSPSSRHREHVVPVDTGFYVSLRGTFGLLSRLAIVYTAFSYMDCFSVPDFLCQNHRCIPSQLHCDGFDHCGDGSDEPNTCYKDWETKQQDQRRYLHTPNYYFPKIDQYPDLKTATCIFVVSSVGLILLIVALIVLLYRMGARTRQQRQIQSHLQTISELLDAARHDETGPPDDPPVYEAPPDYDEVIQVFLEPIESQRQKKKPSQSRGKSIRRSRRNNDASVRPDQCWNLLEVALPGPVACTASSLVYMNNGLSQPLCGTMSRSFQTSPIPDSPPPPYTDATLSVTPGPSSHGQIHCPHSTPRVCRSEKLSKQGHTSHQSWLLFQQESAEDQLLSVIVTGVTNPPGHPEGNGAVWPSTSIPEYEVLIPEQNEGLEPSVSVAEYELLTPGGNGAFQPSDLIPEYEVMTPNTPLLDTDDTYRWEQTEKLDLLPVMNLVSSEDTFGKPSPSASLSDSVNAGQNHVCEETILEIKPLLRYFCSFDDLIMERICQTIPQIREKNSLLIALSNRRSLSHNAIYQQDTSQIKFRSNSELHSNHKGISCEVQEYRTCSQIEDQNNLITEMKNNKVNRFGRNEPVTDGFMVSNISPSAKIFSCDCEGACGCATMSTNTNLQSKPCQRKQLHTRSLSSDFPATSFKSSHSKH